MWCHVVSQKRRDIFEELTASIFRVKKYAMYKIKKQAEHCLLGLSLVPEDGGSTFLQNIS
jgi:hypothetical protein